MEVAKNREPVIVHAAQLSAAQEKLDSFVKKKGRRPNILVFIMDDVGWGDLGAYGGGIAVGAPTPNMDRLAREGLRLTSTYSQPSCSPTRATIMTGRLPMRHGLLRPPMAGEHGGLEGEITMAQLLSEAGYKTVAVGKWHMGENVQSQPQNVGFDEFYGFLTVADIYTEWRDPYFNADIANKPGRQAFVSAIPFSKDLVKAHKGGAVEKVKEIDIPVMEQLDDLLAELLDRLPEVAQGFEAAFLPVPRDDRRAFRQLPFQGVERQVARRLPREGRDDPSRRHRGPADPDAEGHRRTGGHAGVRHVRQRS